jgi:hypothetical protein
VDGGEFKIFEVVVVFGEYAHNLFLHFGCIGC